VYLILFDLASYPEPHWFIIAKKENSRRALGPQRETSAGGQKLNETG